MTKSNFAVVRRKKKAFIRRITKGFIFRSHCFRQAKRQWIKSIAHSFRARKVRQRQIRQLWIIRINAFIRAEVGLKYSQFIPLIKDSIQKKILDRKVITYAINQLLNPNEVLEFIFQNSSPEDKEGIAVLKRKRKEQLQKIKQEEIEQREFKENSVIIFKAPLNR